MIVAFMNEKGGTGKTTLAVHVAYYLAIRRRWKTLLLDLDPQAQAGKILGLRGLRSPELIAYDLFRKNVDLSHSAIPTGRPNLFVVPAHKEMAYLPAIDKSDMLRKNLTDSDFKAVVMDTPPSPSWMSSVALEVADAVVIPVALTYLAMDGSAELLQTLLNRHPHLKDQTFFAPTFYRRTRMAEEILSRMREYFGDRLLPPLGISVRMDEAQSHGKTIWEYDSGLPLAQDLSSLCEKLVKKLKVEG